MVVVLIMASSLDFGDSMKFIWLPVIACWVVLSPVIRCGSSLGLVWDGTYPKVKA